MTDNTAPGRRWVVDQPDYCCRYCGGSDIGSMTDHTGDYVGTYWCSDCSCAIPEPPKVEAIPKAPLLRWLDEQIEYEEAFDGRVAREARMAYRRVKAHIEGRDTHE